MDQNRTQPTLTFGSRLTNLGKRMLLIYGVIYVLELLAQFWIKIDVLQYLVLSSPFHPDFHIWQIVTHPFIHQPGSPIGFLISCLVFFFFSSQVESHFGPRRFLIFFYTAALGAMLGGLLFSPVSGFGGPFFGMMPSLLAAIVVFGFLNPEATILLMFVLPIKARYLSYGTIIITFLTFLAKANPHGAYHLGGILFGWLYFRGWISIPDPDLLAHRYRQRQKQKKRSRFTVLEGKKGRKEK